MEIYILNALYQRVQVVERYESFIWTERFKDVGDMELRLPSYSGVGNDFSHGTFIGMSLSDRIMMVTSYEENHDSEGKRYCIIKGSSMEVLMKHRITAAVLKGVKVDETTNPMTKLVTGTSWSVLRGLIFGMLQGGTTTRDQFSDIRFDLSMPDQHQIMPSEEEITFEIPLGSVYDAVKSVSDASDIGFRFVQIPGRSGLIANTYTGRDRTTSQRKLSPVVFAPELENLTDISELSISEDAKNVCYVFGADAAVEVVAEDVDPYISGTDRRVMCITAEDITKTNTENVTVTLTNLGKSALAKNRMSHAFDGEIRQNSQYVYNKDYALGDIIEFRSESGSSNRMRVTEYIFSSDANGVKSYPTLSLNTYVNAGAWLAWERQKQWVDLDQDARTWSELP